MKYLLLSFAHLVCLAAQAQDLILTTDGDSINAKITKEKKDFLYFTFKHENEVRNTLLPYSQVQEYVYDYFEQPELWPEQVKSPGDYPHWRWALQGGYGRRLAKIGDQVPPPLREHVRQLKSGFNVGTDVVYYLSETIGVGSKYSFFRASNRTGDGNFSIDEKIAIQYVGPVFSFRAIAASGGNMLLSSFSLGYLHYGNQLSGGTSQLTGRTLGICLDVGYDLVLTEHLLLGFQVALTGGTLTRFELDDGHRRQTIELEKEAYEGLGRIDVSVGLRFSR